VDHVVEDGGLEGRVELERRLILRHGLLVSVLRPVHLITTMIRRIRTSRLERRVKLERRLILGHGLLVAVLEKGIQTLMARGRST